MREFLIIENNVLGDLPAINIQRGRDHGIPGYVNFLRLCGGGPATSFNQLPIRAGQRTRLSIAYNSVEDIDLFVGGMSEDPAPGSELGPTFTCIMLQQFKDLRFGDRFWYERDDPVTAFTYPQLTEIRKCSLARLICDNADDVNRIQAKVFKPRNSANPNVDCDRLPFVDLNAFKEGKHISLFVFCILNVLIMLIMIDVRNCLKSYRSALIDKIISNCLNLVTNVGNGLEVIPWYCIAQPYCAKFQA